MGGKTNITGDRTTLDNELTELQKNWQLRPHTQNITFHKELAYNEFLPYAEQEQQQNKALSHILYQAANHVPFYQDLFKKLAISHLDIKSTADLTLLPVLNRTDILRNFEELKARALPPGQKVFSYTQSTGTTGTPVRTLHSNYSNSMFTCLKQRELRWFRLDPKFCLGALRYPETLPQKGNGKLVDIGETLQLPAWPYVGKYFITGPFIGFSVLNPIESQVEWLHFKRPDYLLTYSEYLEYLAFTFKGNEKPDSIKSMIGISEQMTSNMRQHIENTFNIPIHQNYGLNEVGLVASRCPEAGRYHVHSEHCLVEIVDESGKPCQPGQTGKILVTTLTNMAMPLLRYDTDDLAVAPEGPCPCGRTLPSFGEITGRYSRVAYLPENTNNYVIPLQYELEIMPVELSKNLRQYQIHQYKGNRFELRLLAPGGLPEEYTTRISAFWDKIVGEEKFPLEILEVKEISRSPGGKFQCFTSDYFPTVELESTPH